MAYFADTGATSVTSDGSTGYNADTNVNVTGGPMQFDGTDVTFSADVTFKHSSSATTYTLGTDGGWSSSSS
jgi:hypothetical protein